MDFAAGEMIKLTQHEKKKKNNKKTATHTQFANNDERERAIETKDLFLRSQAKLKTYSRAQKLSPEDQTESDVVYVECASLADGGWRGWLNV